MSGCHFWIAVSHHCLPEAQSSGEWLVKRELEKGLTWPHSPDLSSTCSGTTPTSNMEMEKITKHFTDRYLTCQPSLESLLCPPAQAPVPWVTSRKTREHPCPCAQQLWVPQGGTPLITCPIYSPPWLQPSPQHPYKSHHHRATELDFNLCQQQVYGAVGWALPLFGFPGHSLALPPAQQEERADKREFSASILPPWE